MEAHRECLYCKEWFWAAKEGVYFNSFCKEHISLPLNRRILIGLRRMLSDFVIVVIGIISLLSILWVIWSLIFPDSATQERLSNPLIWISISILIAGLLIAIAIADRSNKD